MIGRLSRAEVHSYNPSGSFHIWQSYKSAPSFKTDFESFEGTVFHYIIGAAAAVANGLRCPYDRGIGEEERGSYDVPWDDKYGGSWGAILTGSGEARAGRRRRKRSRENMVLDCVVECEVMLWGGV